MDAILILYHSASHHPRWIPVVLQPRSSQLQTKKSTGSQKECSWTLAHEDVKKHCDRCGVDYLFLAMGTSDPQGSSKFEPDMDDRVANRFTHGPGQFLAMFRVHKSPTQLFIALHVPG